MTARRTIALAAAWVLATIAAVADLLVGLVARRGGVTLEGTAWTPAVAVGFTTVGVLIVASRPRNVIGVLCLAAGLVLAASSALGVVATIDDVRPGAATAMGSSAAVLSSVLKGVSILIFGPLLLVRFPDGRRRSPRWAVVDLLALLAMAAGAIVVLRPGPWDISWVLPFDNPLGIAAMHPLAFDAAVAITSIAGVGAVLGAVASLVVRHRRGGPVERAQIRWVAAAAVAAVTAMGLIVVSAFLPLWFAGIAWQVATFAPVVLPIAIGIAITRYRLYEIDRLVSRSIGWVAVTSLLLGAFVLLVVALQAIAEPLTGGDTVATAASTLVVAALFTPLRSRVQRAVDRRFDRARYDGQRILAAFGEQVRDEVDLATIQSDVLVTVGAAVRPVSAGLWLRTDGPR
jgi:hypothetical protein